ncbi:M67 family metallopeptidase [Limnofasciculus baicalensis]|uniref:M67 family metallopeptidase n=1 Tax=Limnofasciculus baicalensis BBK-W-15 TaxID=2699891 RepID=A0AAE3GWY4_9CYAN|nr:M67 family metallopeptidase [Limnofasciculus baicalensis]MCP2732130.1 M67 family metallopeptidase [Limnofasciculus baicalensis BBK-W-15]
MIKLYSHHIQTMKKHAESTYPEECCGLLLGKIAKDVKTLIEVFPTENTWNDEAEQAFSGIEKTINPSSTKRNRFSIDPKIMLKVLKEARERNLDIIGVYHSHPDCPAVPSEFDRAIAHQGYSYIIISVQQGVPGNLKSWNLTEEGNFQPEEFQ